MSEFKPGRELDALIAVRVMGWRPGHGSWEYAICLAAFRAVEGK